MPRRKEPHIPDAVLDQLLAGADPRTALEPNGLLDDLKKALAERVLNAEMDHHLGRRGTGQPAKWLRQKDVITDTGRIELAVPRDRQASFDPQLIARYQRRFPGFDDKIISMYARGMSTREIVGHLRDLYGNRPWPCLCMPRLVVLLTEPSCERTPCPIPRRRPTRRPHCSTSPPSPPTGPAGTLVRVPLDDRARPQRAPRDRPRRHRAARPHAHDHGPARALHRPPPRRPERRPLRRPAPPARRPRQPQARRDGLSPSAA